MMFRNLGFNQLSGTIPSSIGNLAQLQYLYGYSYFQFWSASSPILTLSIQSSLSLWLCSELLTLISWVERSHHRSEILGNFSSCMFNFVHSCFQFRQQKHIITNSFDLNFSLSLSLFFGSRALAFNQLSGTIPSSIGDLVQLQTLYVHSRF